MITWLRVAIVVASVSVATSSASAQALPAAARTDARERNPRHLDAVQLLEQRASNNALRVRFEWDRVPGATQYVLSGRWTSPPSWAVHTGEFRVTPASAKQWDDEKVLFDVTLPAGNHSWEVVAVFRSASSGDFEHPTIKSFEIK